MIYKNLASPRHALTLALMMAAAFFAQHYFAFSNSWLVVTTFFVCQTRIGSTLRLRLIYLLLISLMVLAVAFLQMHVNAFVILIIYSMVFIAIGLVLLIYRPVTINQFYLLIYILAAILIANFEPITTQQQLMNSMIDVVIGGVLGIVLSRLMISSDLYVAFRQGLMPILQAANALSQSFINELGKQKNAANMIECHKKELENTLIATVGMYPEWVYASGFNPGLRSGFRFFLVNLERVAELLFALSYWITHDLEENLKEKMRASISEAISKNRELISIIQQSFCDGAQHESQGDFVNDIESLEESAKKIMPGNVELLDIAPDYVILAAIIRNIKDTRHLLLQLVAALPGK